MKKTVCCLTVMFLMIYYSFCLAAGEGQGKSKEEKMKEAIKAADVPINFYGKVIDQNGKPVEDAQIIVHVRHFDPNVALWLMATKEIILKTKNNGKFDVINEKGSHLFIDKVEKRGYEFTYDSNTKTGFEYSAHLEKNRFKPDPSNPVIFTVRKKEAATLVITFEFGFGVGTEKKVEEKEVDLVQKEAARPGYLAKYSEAGHIDLLIKAEMSQGKTGYQITFTTPDSESGITEQQELLYTVPDAGYKPTKTIIVPWESESQKYLYVKSRQGGVYARLDLKIKATKERLGINVKSWANPTGSRNVDFDEELYSKELDRRMEERQRKNIEREERKKLKQQKQ